MDAYEKSFDDALMLVVYDMMQLESKSFLPVGLELNSMDIVFKRDDTFALKGMTFAYYHPIDNAIYINIDDPFFKNVSEAQRYARLFLVLYHESMHKILNHTARCGTKQHTLWNIAGDYEIHNMLYMLDKCVNYSDLDKVILQKYTQHIEQILFKNNSKKSTPENPKFCFSEKYIENIAEEIYEMIQNSAVQQEQTMSIDMNQMGGESGSAGQGQDGDGEQSGNSGVDVKVTKTTYKLPDGTEYTDVNIEWPDDAQLNKAGQGSDEQAEKAKQNAKNTTDRNRALLENTMGKLGQGKGDFPTACKKFLKKLFHIKVDWEKILRNSLQTALDKADYFAWSKIRTSSFLLPNMSYLPDVIEDESKYGTLIISRDESGSMSDEMIEKASAIILEAKDFYKKIIILKHDTDISAVEEIEDISDDSLKTLLTRESCGGTSHKAVFEWIRDYARTHREDDRISCYIGITDLESDIEHCQNILPDTVPAIYLCPMNYDKSYDTGINGKVIPIEL